jgi:DNA-directed RNA polymerase subunit alpha
MQNKEYKPLTIPNISWEQSKSTDVFGQLIAEPLETGFGTTLGNALRRVILSSIEGAAVTSVVMKGTNNEFSSVSGIVEDVVDVMLNIKGIVIKNTTGLPGKMTLRKTGEGVALAGDIETDEHLEVLNSDHVIAHVASDGDLDIEFFVETGRGYQVSQWPAGQPLQEDGRIFLDALFSPIKRVEYHVEKTRVGKTIDYDKLIFDVHTDGSIHPQDVIQYATSVLRTQLEHFLLAAEIPFNEISKVEEEEPAQAVTSQLEGPTKGLPVELFLKPIEELEFSVRAHNCLVSAGVKRVIDLVNINEEDILKIKNFGRKSLREVKEILKAFKLHFGMNIKELDLKKLIKDQEGA